MKSSGYGNSTVTHELLFQRKFVNRQLSRFTISNLNVCICHITQSKETHRLHEPPGVCVCQPGYCVGSSPCTQARVGLEQVDPCSSAICLQVLPTACCSHVLQLFTTQREERESEGMRASISICNSSMQIFKYLKFIQAKTSENEESTITHELLTQHKNANKQLARFIV